MKFARNTSMKYKPIYLPTANLDIARMDKYLSEYPSKAKRIFQEMDKKVTDLETMPHMWPIYTAKPEYRRMILEDYLLFYKIDEDNHMVRIYRILHGKMDIPEHF